MTCRPLKLLPNPAAAARNTTATAALRAESRAGVGADALQTQVVRLTPLTTARYQAGISVRNPPSRLCTKSTWLLLWVGLWLTVPRFCACCSTRRASRSTPPPSASPPPPPNPS